MTNNSDPLFIGGRFMYGIELDALLYFKARAQLTFAERDWRLP